MALRLGDDAKFYYNSATHATPTWVEVSNVKSLSLSEEDEEVDVTVRGSNKFKEYIQGHTDVTVDFEMLDDDSDPAYIAFRAAKQGRTGIEVLVLNGPDATPGNDGVRFFAMVKTFSRSENLSEAIMREVSLRPLKNADSPPTYYTST